MSGKVRRMAKFNQKGIAMPIVMAVIAIVLIIGTAAFVIAENQTLAVSAKKDSEDALHIAEAGYYKYLWYLNDNSNFYKIAAPLSEFIPIEFYPSTDPLWGGYPKKYAATEYKNGGTLLGYYQIEIVPPTTEEPVVAVKSTGWSAKHPDRKRTVEVKIHKKQFTNYVDFSGDMKTVNGTSVYWGDGEQIRGPIHTNGTLRTMGVPVFHDSVTYAVGTDFNNGTPSFLKAGQPVKGMPLVFPDSNKDLVYWADPIIGGYSYSGRTSICMDGNTLYICNVNTNGDARTQRMLPSSGVIYVNGDVFISGKLDGALTVVAEGNIYITGKDPTNFTYSSAAFTGGITYANQNIPTSPTMTFTNPCDDMLGLVANGAILINTRYWPVKNSNSFASASAAISNIKVQAAVFGLSSGSYYGVDNYGSLGNMGYIYFTGSKISSKVGATYTTDWSGGIHGYREDNGFDYRFSYDAPPHFLEPKNAGWEVREWKED